MTRPRAALCFAALALLAPACVPPEETADLGKPYPDTTAMGIIQERGEMRIGVPADAEPLGFLEGNEPRGMTVDLAMTVAKTLGVTPRLLPAPNEELVGMVDRDDADVAFVVSPLTEELVRRYSFSTPYYIAHERLLVPTRSAVERPADLAGKRACSFVNPDTDIPLQDLEPRARAIDTPTPEACARLLRSGRAEAAVGPDDALMEVLTALGGRSRDWEIRGDELSTSGYGVAVSTGSTSFATYVSSVLTRAEIDGAWADAYERWVEPYRGPADPPDIGVEEAAALFPDFESSPS
jgi:polar amino acid transport system substrate-binding protein